MSLFDGDPDDNREGDDEADESEGRRDHRPEAGAGFGDKHKAFLKIVDKLVYFLVGDFGRADWHLTMGVLVNKKLN